MNDPQTNLMRSPDQPNDADSGLPIPIPGVGGAQSEVADDSLADGVDSAVRVEAASEAAGEEAEQAPRYLFARISVIIIMLTWVIAGLTKVMDISKFVGIVDQHRVLPDHLKDLLWWVGPGELVMGLLLVFVIGSELRKPFGKIVLLISMGAIGGFIYYISLVDPVILQESGCGCWNDFRIASGIQGSERIVKYGMNVILIILHLVALFGPAMVDSRRRLG